jgi:hypothetical protein
MMVPEEMMMKRAVFNSSITMVTLAQKEVNTLSLLTCIALTRILINSNMILLLQHAIKRLRSLARQDAISSQ